MKRKLIYLLTMFLLTLVSGIFWGTWLALIHSLESLSSDEFIHVGKLIINNVSLPGRIIMISSTLMMILALWYYRYKRSLGFYLGLASFFLMVISVVITFTFMGPLEHQIAGWTTNAVPPQWEYIRDQWKLFYALGTLSTLASIGCFSWFILAAMKKNKTANY